MEQILKFTKQDFSIDVSKLKFSLVPTADAAGDVPVIEWYKEVLLDETSRDLFLNVPFNKDRKRIPQIKPAGRTLKPFTYGFDASDINLDAKKVSVDKMSAMYQICVADIEDSFEVWNMTAGANQPVSPAIFLNYVWSEIGRYVKADVEYLRWNGDKSDTGSTFNSLTNGYMTLVADNIGQVNVVTGAKTITNSNVIDELAKALGQVDSVIRADSANLDIFVSSDVALAFAVSAAKGNTQSFVTGDMGMMFLGKYRLTEVAELANSTILITPKSDIIYTYDLADENFITADLTLLMAEPVIRFRVNLYIGFDFYDYTKVTYYGPAL